MNEMCSENYIKIFCDKSVTFIYSFSLFYTSIFEKNMLYPIQTYIFCVHAKSTNPLPFFRYESVKVFYKTLKVCLNKHSKMITNQKQKVLLLVIPYIRKSILNQLQYLINMRTPCNVTISSLFEGLQSIMIGSHVCVPSYVCKLTFLHHVTCSDLQFKQ